MLNHVTDILNKLPGKSVVSSDHGELLGERLRPVPIRGYAHPRGIRHPSLIRVPWAVYNNGARKKILDEGTSNKSVENVNVEKQLELLGYQ